MTIICPWCGTSYLAFQPNCKNCGGPLQPVVEQNLDEVSGDRFPVPPPAPRPISDRYVWKLLSSDGWGIGALVFGILGAVFTLVGMALTLAVVTAFVGIPFLILGIVFLGAGVLVFRWRYKDARKVVDVLRDGQSTRGQILNIQPNYSINVNGRNPWVISYQFQVNGQDYRGEVSTLNPPEPRMQPGKTVYILYLPLTPQWSSIYPHP
jgi:hypothetical protein